MGDKKWYENRFFDLVNSSSTNNCSEQRVGRYDCSFTEGKTDFKIIFDSSFKLTVVYCFAYKRSGQ